MEENNSLFTINGVINRRNFITNILTIIVILEVIFSTPAVYYMFTHPEIIKEILVQGTVPYRFMIYVLIIGIVKCILYTPSIIKRIRDITGGQNKNTTLVCSITIFVMFASIFSLYMLSEFAHILKWIVLFIIIFLATAKGKITGAKPENDIYKFNWGAFLGTWIWGIFNKSYKTLWMIPLLFTTAAFPFMLVCGLKGNKWAYQNKHCNSAEEFHKSQSKQAMIWGFLTPILMFAMFILSILVMGTLMTQYSKTHPDYMGKIINLVQAQQVQTAKNTFSKIELTADEYKFYINPKIWAKSPTSHKKALLNAGDIYTYDHIKNNDITEYFGIHPEILLKTKIYSDFNNELLGEYFVDDKYIHYIKSNDIKYDIIETKKQILNGYRFNYHPSLP